MVGWVTTFLTGAKVPGFCEGGVHKETKRVDFCTRATREERAERYANCTKNALGRVRTSSALHILAGKCVEVCLPIGLCGSDFCRDCSQKSSRVVYGAFAAGGRPVFAVFAAAIASAPISEAIILQSRHTHGDGVAAK